MQTKWTKDDDKRLKKFFPHMTCDAVAERLGRSVGSVKQRAVRLGLKKTKKHLKSLGWKV